jgi:hypothetical protein
MTTTYSKELRTALATFRKGVKPALKTAQNPHFKSRYAPLDEVFAAFKPALEEAGLVIEQWTTERDDGATFLHTRLFLVETGDTTEESVCRLRIPQGRDDMPSLGSAQTYARRQQVLLVAMIAPEDDDGVSIVDNGAREVEKFVRNAPVVKATADAMAAAQAVADGDPMSMATKLKISNLIAELKMNKAEVDALCARTVKRERAKWTEGDAKLMVAELRKIKGSES